jgi:hypothetical protein
MGGRSGAMGCVWGILSELHALLGVSRFYCLFGDVDVSPVLETSVYICCVFGGFFCNYPSEWFYLRFTRKVIKGPALFEFQVSVKT